MSNRKYSKEDCIESIREAAEEVDGKLSSTKYQKLGYSPSIWAINRRFDTWNKAKEKAGLEISDTHSATKEQRRTDIPDILNISEDEWKKLHTEQRYRKRQQAWMAKKKIEEGCDKCNYNEHPRALHYHHKNPSEKEFGISQALNSGYGKDTIIEETKKCILLCANCHSVEESDTYNISVR